MTEARADDPAGARRQHAGRGFLWFVVVGNGLLGTSLTVIAMAILVEGAGWSTPTCLLVAAVGVLWVAMGSVGFYRMYLRRPPLDGRRVTATPDGRGLELGWSATVLRVPLLTVTALVALLVLATGAQLASDSAGAWLFGALAVALSLVLPDGWARLRRKHTLRLDVDGLAVLGWDGDARLAWDDVADVTMIDSQSWTTLRVVGRAGAPSYRWARRPRLLFAAEPTGPYLDVPAPTVDVDVFALASTIAHYARNPAARQELADGTARRRLVQDRRPSL